MRTCLWSFIALASIANAEHWIFGSSRPIVTTRLDPIVMPNEIGPHVHTVVGGSRFKSVYDPDDLVQSNCSTIPVQPDKSNYWAPQLYHQDQESGLFTQIPTYFNIYYLMRPGPKNESINAFPPGLRMLAGDTNRRSYNSSDFAQQAVSFVCLGADAAQATDPDWAERPNFFDHNCPYGMRAQVFFPSCWDGINLDSPDHKSHMAYPLQAYNTGDCPDTHPVHLVSLFYEMVVSVDQFDYWGAGTWVLANGDTTGYGHHGDFTNGWDVDLLQEAIDTCTQAQGNVLDCPPLAAAIDQATADACVLETAVVDEDTGFSAPIAALPGCNPLWNGTGARPTCSGLPVAELVPVQTPLPTNWSEIGCIAEGANGRALTGASTTSGNMTRASCAAFCQEKGFALAGVEYSDECYCDNELRNGASNATVLWNECANRCAGNTNEICGGPMRLTLLVTSGLPPPPSDAVLPAGWSSVGCVSDNSARALTGFSVTNDEMTYDSCISACAARGYSMAGIEYGSECYCGHSFENGAGVSLDPSTCSMDCAGDSTTTCGGSWALTAFQSNATIALPSSVLSSGATASASASLIASVIASASVSAIITSLSTAAPAPSASANASPPSNANVSLPDGWSALGCRQDDVSGRTLDVDAFTSDNMTIAECIAHCAALGHPIAGVEYARECYCGSAFVNGGGAVLPDAACDMACSGDATTLCGGPGALSAFQTTSATGNGDAGAASRRRAYRPRGVHPA